MAGLRPNNQLLQTCEDCAGKSLGCSYTDTRSQHQNKALEKLEPENILQINSNIKHHLKKYRFFSDNIGIQAKGEPITLSLKPKSVFGNVNYQNVLFTFWYITEMTLNVLRQRNLFSVPS